MEKFTHPVPPLYNENSKVLILGSFPSPKSREAEFFYMHPQNRFWKVIYGIFDEQVSDSVEDRKKFVLEHNLAIWDVLHSCEIEGASDSSIKNIVVNDFSKIFSAAHINAIFITGQTAFKLYRKHCAEKYDIPYFRLPSTSPANCRVKYNELEESYKKILEYI